MDADELQWVEEALDDFDWSVFGEPEEPRPDYDNSGALDIHLYSDHARVQKAAEFVSSEIGNTIGRAVTHAKVVLLNLYWTNHLSPDRWIGVSLRHDRNAIPFRYNPQRIEMYPLTKVLRGLIRHRYIVRRKGFYNRALKTGRCTRFKATDKLIDLLVGRFEFNVGLVKRHPDEETILLKDENKELVVYKETDDTPKLRKFLNEYNTFLLQTYIDIDYMGYVRVKKVRWTSPAYLERFPKQLNFNLAKRRMRRVFNEGSFIRGGRFYGGFWMEMPSQLRLRIILDCQKVVEADYSGIHIHLLYNKINIDYGATGEDPYAVPGYPVTTEYRNLFKKLLLAAVNAKGDNKRTGPTRAIMALQKDINYNPGDFPVVIPDLEAVIAAFQKHHKPIAKYLFTGRGLWLMYQDSKIAELVLREMYAHRVPVLPVHDSFICPKQDVKLLLVAMTRAYRRVAGRKLTVTPYTVNIKRPDEWDMTGGDPNLKDEDYYYDITMSKDQDLIDHFIRMEGDALYCDEEDGDGDTDTPTKIVTPHKLLISVPVEYVEA